MKKSIACLLLFCPVILSAQSRVPYAKDPFKDFLYGKFINHLAPSVSVTSGDEQGYVACGKVKIVMGRMNKFFPSGLIYVEGKVEKSFTKVNYPFNKEKAVKNFIGDFYDIAVKTCGSKNTVTDIQGQQNDAEQTAATAVKKD